MLLLPLDWKLIMPTISPPMQLLPFAIGFVPFAGPFPHCFSLSKLFAPDWIFFAHRIAVLCSEPILEAHQAILERLAVLHKQGIDFTEIVCGSRSAIILSSVSCACPKRAAPFGLNR